MIANNHKEQQVTCGQENDKSYAERGIERERVTNLKQFKKAQMLYPDVYKAAFASFSKI